MRLNSSGFPVISYLDFSGKLKLLVCSNAACTTRTTRIVDAPPSVYVGSLTSLALNGNNPVITYYDSTNLDLKIAICDDSTCSTRTVSTIDSPNDVGAYSSVELNASGFPVISYTGSTTGSLRLIVCGDALCSSMTFSVPDTGPNVGQYTSLELNASGFAVISYYSNAQGDLKLVVCNDATCSAPTVTTVDSSGGANVGIDSEMVLNASGFPVISYYDNTNDDLKLAVCSNATCSTKTIRTLDSGGDVGRYGSVALNASGFPIISYYDRTNGNLKLAVCNDATCSAPTISVLDYGTAGADVGWHSTLTLDASGFPIISYYDFTNGDLKLIVCTNATCTP